MGLRLPRVEFKGRTSFEEVLNARRSWKRFQNYVLKNEEIGQLLWAGYGLRNGEERSRTVPSAGGIRPIVLYFLNQAGLYRYHPAPHELEPLKSEDLRREVAQSSAGQIWMADASGIFILTVDFAKCLERYGERGRRYALIEVGHVGQNICLQAQALGLRSRGVGAFKDRTLQRLLALPKEHEIQLLIPVGFYAQGS